MSDYDIHKSPEYAATQQTSFIVRYITIQQAGIPWKISWRQSGRIYGTHKHSNYSSVPFRTRDFDLYLSRKGSRVERKHQFTSPSTYTATSGVLALQATGTVMPTGEAAQTLGSSSVNTEQVRSLYYLPTIKTACRWKKCWMNFLTFGRRDYPSHLNTSNFFRLCSLQKRVNNSRCPCTRHGVIKEWRYSFTNPKFGSR